MTDGLAKHHESVVIVGGCGHVGLPFGALLANRGASVTLLDRSIEAVELVGRAQAPFHEPGLDELLAEVVAAGSLSATTDPACVQSADVVVIVVGTPIDEHLNPDIEAVARVIDEIASWLRDGQLLVLRSTVFPGVTAHVEASIERLGLAIHVVFCPERIAEGHALAEMVELPQLVGARTDEAMARSAAVFGLLTDQLVRCEPEEAELAKLFTNAWRYLKFAAANQFFMIANDFGIDYESVRQLIVQDYPRAADLPRSGFAAGPCLFKDTMQLAAFNNNNFPLGQASVVINEGLPLYLVSRIESRFGLEGRTVGILGMAFKGESDDARSSLSYKLRRILRFKARSVLCTDPYVRTDPALLPIEEVLERADLLVIGAPHNAYASLTTDLPVVDIWGIRGQGVLV